MPGAMTGVKRSESLNSNRSDLSHKKVSFNKDVSVKHIPRGAFLDRNGQLIAVMPESADPKLWFASRKAERLNPDDIAREAQEILTQLDQVTCTASASPFQEHPHSHTKTQHVTPTATRNNMYSQTSSYSKSLPNPHKKNNIESKNNKIKNVADKNKLNKEASRNKGSTSSTEKRRKSLETILETGGHNGYINFNSVNKSNNESTFSDSDNHSRLNEKRKSSPVRKSPQRETHYQGKSQQREHYQRSSPQREMLYRGSSPKRETHYRVSSPKRETHYRGSSPKHEIHHQDSPKQESQYQGTSGVKALVSHFNEESQRRQQDSLNTSSGLVPMVGVLEPSRDNNHNNNQPFSYLRPHATPPDLTESVDIPSDAYRSEGHDEVDKGKDLKSPREVVYAQVVVKNKDRPSKATVHTKVTSKEDTTNKTHSYNGIKYPEKKQSPERYESSTYPRPRDRSKSSENQTNVRSKSPVKDKVQMRISNDSSGKTKIYLTNQDIKNKTPQKHVARVNLNSSSSPRRGSADRTSPERHYYYGESNLERRAGHKPIAKTNSDSSAVLRAGKRTKTYSESSGKNDLTSMRLVKQANEKSFTTKKSEQGKNFLVNRPVKEVQSEGEDKKKKKVKITFHDKPSRTESDIENLKGFVEYKGQGSSDKEDKIQRSRKHFLSAFLEKAPRGPLHFKKKDKAPVKPINRRRSDPFDSDSQMVWSSPGEDMDDVLRYSNSDSGHKAAPKLWFSSDDLGWPDRVDSSLERPAEKKLKPPASPRAHSLDRRPKSPREVAHRSPNYLSRMNRYLSEESESEVGGGLRRHRPGASMGELHRRGQVKNTDETSDRRRRQRIKRSVSSAAILNPRDPISSTGSTANSSESENGTTSGNSGRSVYLHAMTVVDIPPLTTRAGSSILSKEEMLEKPGRQRQSRSVTRSSSVVAPWKPRHYREPYDINYTTNGRPPRPPRKRDKIQVNATTEKNVEGPNAVRRVQTAKDGTKLAGWFKKKRREPSPTPTSQPKQELRHR